MQLLSEYKNLPELYTGITMNNLLTYDGHSVCIPTNMITKLHFHSLYEIGVCRSGSGLCIVGSEAVAISSGDIMFILPDTPHYSRSLTEKCMCDFIYFDADKLLTDCGIAMPGLLPAGRFNPPFIFRAGETGLRETLLNLTDAVIKGLPSYEKLAAAYYTVFLLELAETHSQCDFTQPVSTQNDTRRSRLYPALQKICVAYSDNITLSGLAAECYMGASSFSRLFRSEYGMSPCAYLNRFRVKIGAQLLFYTECSITEISSRIGFNSTSDFYRHFIVEFGCPPSLYRKNGK